MDVLLRDNIKKYKDNIAYSKKKLNCMRSKNDSNQHGGFPYKKMEDVLHNTIKFKDTNTQHTQNPKEKLLLWFKLHLYH